MGQLDIVCCQQNALKVTFALYSAENACPGSNQKEISDKSILKINKMTGTDWHIIFKSAKVLKSREG